jgi:8-oxo-dGTP diphosphatase
MVGGKIELGENGSDAAYRELFEETSIARGDVELTHLMDFTYYIQDCYVEIYAGKLKRDIEIAGEENELLWLATNHNFFDMNLFAGEGNIGHIFEQVKISASQLFSDK